MVAAAFAFHQPNPVSGMSRKERPAELRQQPEPA
jgi:hypothetical protein